MAAQPRIQMFAAFHKQVDMPPVYGTPIAKFNSECVAYSPQCI